MTLEEAIKHAEEVAQENLNIDEKELGLMYCDDTECIESYKNSCIKCAEEHKQLAEWLKDYKRLLKQEPCEDCVSRQALNILVDELARAISNKRWDITRGRSTASIMQDILDLPPVTPTFPKGATNGNMILNMFDTATVYGIDKENDCITICIDNNFYQKFRYSWWNEPYESEGE